jgi:hypothetical protein
MQIEAWMERSYDHPTVQSRPAGAAEQIKAALAAVPGARYPLHWLPVLSSDPSAADKLMEGAQALGTAAKLEEVEKLVDSALELVEETDHVPDGSRPK